MQIKLDGTITVGNLVTAGTFIISCLTVIFKISREYSKFEGKVDLVEQKMNILFDWWTHQIDESTNIRLREGFFGKSGGNGGKDKRKE